MSQIYGKYEMGISLQDHSAFLNDVKRNGLSRGLYVTQQASMPVPSSRRHFLDEFLDTEEVRTTIYYLYSEDIKDGGQLALGKISLTDEVTTYLCFRNLQTSMEIWCPVIETKTMLIILVRKLTINGLGSQLEQAVKRYLTDKSIEKLYQTYRDRQANPKIDTSKLRIPARFYAGIEQCLQIDPVGPCLYCNSPIYGLPGRVTATTGDINSDIAIAVDLRIPIELFGTKALDKFYPSLESAFPNRLYSFSEIGDSGSYMLPFYTNPSLNLCDSFIDLAEYICIEPGTGSSAIRSKYNIIGDTDEETSLVTYEAKLVDSKVSLQLKDAKESNGIVIKLVGYTCYTYHRACSNLAKSIYDKVNLKQAIEESTCEINACVADMESHYATVVSNMRSMLRRCAHIHQQSQSQKQQQRQFSASQRYPGVPPHQPPGMPPNMYPHPH